METELVAARGQGWGGMGWVWLQRDSTRLVVMFQISIFTVVVLIRATHILHTSVRTCICVHVYTHTAAFITSEIRISSVDCKQCQLLVFLYCTVIQDANIEQSRIKTHSLVYFFATSQESIMNSEQFFFLKKLNQQKIFSQ